MSVFIVQQTVTKQAAKPISSKTQQNQARHIRSKKSSKKQNNMQIRVSSNKSNIYHNYNRNPIYYNGHYIGHHSKVQNSMEYTNNNRQKHSTKWSLQSVLLQTQTPSPSVSSDMWTTLDPHHHTSITGVGRGRRNESFF